MPNPKVKNMPRQQQMAVKASMAEQAAMKMVKKSSALKKYLQHVKLPLNVNLKCGLALMLLVGV